MLHLHALALLLQSTSDAVGYPAALPHHHVGWLKHASEATRGFFERFGLWGLAAIALLDSAILPMPWQVLLISDVHEHPSTYLLYPLVAALASAVGSVVPYYAGRVGGELFLLGKINRERYERLRDRFERQEFLAIFLPAMGPPPTPIKLFEFCAGVFEMKLLPFLLAIFLGKCVQFFAYAVVTHVYGPGALGAMAGGIHHHGRLMVWIFGLLLLLLAVWMLRKIFDRRRGTPLPVEEGDSGRTVIVEE